MEENKVYRSREYLKNPYTGLVLFGCVRASMLPACPPGCRTVVKSPDCVLWRVAFSWWEQYVHLSMCEGTSIPAMCGTLVREGSRLLHRLKSKSALSSGCARVSVAGGMWVMDRKRSVPVCAEGSACSSCCNCFSKKIFPRISPLAPEGPSQDALSKATVWFLGQMHVHARSQIIHAKPTIPPAYGSFPLCWQGKGSVGAEIMTELIKLIFFWCLKSESPAQAPPAEHKPTC